MSVSITTNLANIAANAQIQSILAPVGAVTSTVTDILAAADNIAGTIANTANAVLSTFQAPMNDPIQVSFNEGQQYAGTFITTPTASLIPLELAEQALASSTFGVALLSAAQLAALAIRTGISIVNDVDLASAMGALFNEYSNNAQLGFSINLYDSSAFTNYSYTPTYSNSYNIIPLTPNPAIVSLQYFVQQIAGMFPNTTNISGIVSSVWVDGLSLSTGTSGIPTDGIPAGIDPNLYQDITSNATGFTNVAPVVIVDYSYQQNYFNTVVALAIDNGLSTTLSGLLTTALVNDTTRQILKNRLPSVALRGDTEMLLAIIKALGAPNVPNTTSLVSTIISAANPTDMPTPNLPTITFYAGGSPITTNTPQKTLAALITDINSITTYLGITPQQAFTQNTCSSVMCSQSLLNVSMLKAANVNVLSGLFNPTTIAMAQLF